jgi:hypothetical protein
MQNYLPISNFETLIIETSCAEFSHESGFFVRQINPYVQLFSSFYKIGNDVTIRTTERGGGGTRKNVGQLSVYC